MPNKVMKRSDMPMSTATRGEEVAKRLEQLKGKSNQGLVPDHSRGAGSPLGQRMLEAKKRERSVP